MKPLLTVADIRHGYDGRSVLEIERLDIFAGETLCMLGPNGAGKSTLVRLLNLVESPREGAVLLEGKKAGPRDLKARRRMAGVFQRPYMYRGSVFENVACGLKLRRRPGAEVAERVGRELESLGIAHLAAHDARTLSGGEAQRVALARALAIDPEILFLDEPGANLDPLARRDLYADLREIVSRRRMTVVYVTQYVDEVREVGDRVAFLRDGRLEQAGTIDDLLRTPASAFISRFLGADDRPPARLASVKPATAAAGQLIGLRRVRE